jgi:hypothetical protein
MTFEVIIGYHTCGILIIAQNRGVCVCIYIRVYIYIIQYVYIYIYHYIYIYPHARVN